MNALPRTMRPILSALLATAVMSFASYASLANAQEAKVMLSGDQEVPPVQTAAKGSGTISVGADMSVTGTITTTGVDGSMAHVHEAPPGQNGKVVIPLTKSGDGAWTVPPGKKLTDAQYKAFKAGNLYVNVHSAAHQGGEIRGQIKP